jgi:hypothetical protein
MSARRQGAREQDLTIQIKSDDLRLAGTVDHAADADRGG